MNDRDAQILNYLRYSPDIEQSEPDEAEAIDGIIAAMTQQNEIVADRGKHAVRASHAKSTGLAIGELVVGPGLPPEVRPRHSVSFHLH